MTEPGGYEPATADRIEAEHWRAVATRALYGCCAECRLLLREQLQQEEARPQP